MEAKEQSVARQYFNSQSADSIIVEQSITPTTTETSIFSTSYTLCQQAFPVPFGQAGPYAGQIFEFTAGGLITAPTTGTLTIKCYSGQGASATSFTGAVALATSVAQTVPSTALTNSPWRMQGNLIFRTISSQPSSSAAVVYGTFCSQGILATTGSAFVIPFASASAITVDTSGTVANAYGCLTFTVTYSVTGGTFKTEYTSMQSLN